MRTEDATLRFMRYTRLLIGAGILSALIAGCATTEGPRTVWRSPVFLPDSQATPRIIVYGDLSRLLPHFDVTPAIELFLYGPDDYGKTILRNPQGLACVGNRLLVCDQGRFDLISLDLVTGKSIGWADRNRPPRCPVDVAIGPGGWAYVADTTARAVLVYDAGGKYVEQITPGDCPHFGPVRPVERSQGESLHIRSAPSTRPGEMGTVPFRPAAVLPAGDTLYIADLGSRAVQRWDLAAHRWLEPLAPTGRWPLIAPAGLALTPEDTLLVVDAIGGRIHRAAKDGRWLEPVGRPGRSAGEFVRPKGICCTPSGMILVLDAGRQSLLAFRSDGRVALEIEGRPQVWVGFTLPTGILCLPAAEVPLIDHYVESKGWPKSPEYIIVSDSLGGTSLTLLGVVAAPAEGGRNAD